MINTDIFRYRKPTEEQLARMARVTEAQKSVETYLLNLHVVGPWYDDFRTSVIALAETVNEVVPHSRYLALAGTALESLHMEGNQAQSHYPEELHSSRTATSDSAMAALKVVGQWARRGIALEPTAPARGT